MCCTCKHVLHMSKMIQLRHVPDDVHGRLKAQAAQAGLSLSDYLVREVTLIARQPTLQDVVERIRKREPVSVSEDSAAAVRAEREA